MSASTRKLEVFEGIPRQSTPTSLPRSDTITISKCCRILNMRVDWDTVFASEWFLPTAGSFLSLVDLCHLLSTNRSCRIAVLAFIPDDMKELLRKWESIMPSKLLLFGLHHALKKASASGYQLPPQHRNPAPIIQFSFDLLGFDRNRNKICGNPWTELVPVNSLPRSLGRIHPIICPVDEVGSAVFCCGGRLSAENQRGKWLEVREMDAGPTSVAALFEVKTASWKELPSMPEARCNAGVCRIGSRVYIIGGILADTTWIGDLGRHTRSIIGFDLDREEWFDRGLVDFPGEAFGGFAAVAKDETTIVVAGGVRYAGWGEYGPLIGLSQEAFLLNTADNTWTRLPDLPDCFANHFGDNECTGFLYRRNHQEPSTCAVVNGNQWAHFVANDRWEVLPTITRPDGLRFSGCTVGVGVGVGGAAQAAVAVSSFDNLLFTGSLWRALPRCKPIVDSSGETMDVHPEKTSRITIVSGNTA